MEFLNSALNCPFSTSGLLVLIQFLGIQDAKFTLVESPSTTISTENNRPRVFSALSDDVLLSFEDAEMSSNKSAEILALSSLCETELMRAENRGRLAQQLAASLPVQVLEGQQSGISNPLVDSFPEPLLPTHVTDHLQEAMHIALIRVMEERDEAHAQLVSSSVLHTHTLEQEKQKIERLKSKLEEVKKVQLPAPGPGLFRNINLNNNNQKKKEENEFREKLEKKEAEMQQLKENTDAEIAALCHQLSSEISSRTKAALEVIRLKESRTIERDQEAEEKEALKSELLRMKELVRNEQNKAKEAQEESQRWKQSYERAIDHQENYNHQNGI